MNSVLVKSALEKILNPNILVNLVSRRVRELNRGETGSARPLVLGIENLRAADIALREIIEGKLSFDFPEFIELTGPSSKNRRKPHHWTSVG